ncbi:MAG: hypothetical protein V7651_09240 [Hyphomonas oceanitis]|uniref:hypothetical protein n=1 Tax=Hyphomonas oceanitis TaxID=81033 RepID=UPI003001091C
MISWFDLGERLTGYLDRLAYPETKLAIKHAAKMLGAKAAIKGENGLIFISPYGLLFYIGGPDLQAYCCVCDQESLNLQAAKRLHFHQHEEPLQRNSWIWFPRLSEQGATNYKMEKSDRHYAWIINRVQPAVETRFEANSRRDAIVAMGTRIASDFQAYQETLAGISPNEPMSA